MQLNVDSRENPRLSAATTRVRTVSARACIASALAASILAVPVRAQDSGCTVEPFKGATLPSGAVARMRVVNNGVGCAIVNYGVPAEKINPADSGTITTQAKHGKAEFVAPVVRYTPERGYVGEDAFEYDAMARGKTSQQVRLKVQVKVVVVAP